MPPPPPRAARSAAVALLTSLGVLGCSEVIEPVDDGPPPSSSDWIIPLRPPGSLTFSTEEGPDCPAVPECAIVEQGEEAAQCICTLPGVTATVNPPDPGLPPDWPDAPGWPPFIDFDDPAWGEPPPVGEPGTACDPHAIYGGCTLELELECTTRVVREADATCTLRVSPAEALQYVAGWHFRGDDGFNRTSGSTSLTWQGPVVTSGEVRVDLRAGGIDRTVVSRISVRPRTGSAWSWSSGSGITIQQELLPWQGGSSWGTVCRPGQSCPGHIVVPFQGLGHNNGYTRTSVSGDGPNAGAWYVAGVTMDLNMASQVNPALLPGGPAYPARGADAFACGEHPSDTVFVSFIDYNEQCRSQSMDPFIGWAWSHEMQHMVNAMVYVETVEYPRWDPWANLESLVGQSSSILDSLAVRSIRDVPICVGRASATHAELGVFPGLPNPIWAWGATQSFYQIASGSKWWENIQTPSPFSDECG